MLPLISEKFFTNRFVETQLPTKAEIFARTGQRAVNPAGSYSGEELFRKYRSKTESAEAFARSADSFELPKDE